jgi:3-hydroxyacyl-CoA dehydrogenase/enoyl-CoA hydratase/3-hydroxybutyryl-CoA epimerase
MGIDKAVSKLQQLAKQHGSRFTPAPILIDMARKQQRFYP